MVVLIIKKHNGPYTRELRVFKRKGIKYRLFLLWYKLIHREYEIVGDNIIKR